MLAALEVSILWNQLYFFLHTVNLSYIYMQLDKYTDGSFGLKIFYVNIPVDFILVEVV